MVVRWNAAASAQFSPVPDHALPGNARAEHIIPEDCRDGEIAVPGYEVVLHVMAFEEHAYSSTHGPMMTCIMSKIIGDITANEAHEHPRASIASHCP